MSQTYDGVTYPDNVLDGFGYAAIDGTGKPLIVRMLNGAVREAASRRPHGVGSTTSIAIGTGSKAFTLSTAATLLAGTYLIYSGADAANWMLGTLAADVTNGTGFTVTVNATGGSGTHTDWQIATPPDRRAILHTEITDDYTMLAADISSVLDVTVDAKTIDLLAAATAGDGQVVCVKNYTTGLTTITADTGGDTIEGAASWVLYPGNSAVFQAVAANDDWVIVQTGGCAPSPYIPASLNNSYTNVSGQTSAYRKHLDGTVEIVGAVEAGTATLTIFTLDAGYRPVMIQKKPVLNSNTGAMGTLTIATSGVVTCTIGGGSNVLEFGLRFPTA